MVKFDRCLGSCRSACQNSRPWHNCSIQSHGVFLSLHLVNISSDSKPRSPYNAMNSNYILCRNNASMWFRQDSIIMCLLGAWLVPCIAKKMNNVLWCGNNGLLHNVMLGMVIVWYELQLKMQNMVMRKNKTLLHSFVMLAHVFPDG